MPYSNPKQPIAVFLDIKRRRGTAAAESWAKKHRGEMSKGAKALHDRRAYRRPKD